MEQESLDQETTLGRFFAALRQLEAFTAEMDVIPTDMLSVISQGKCLPFAE